LCDEVGLGKTVQAVEAAKEVKASTVLLICPKNLKPWWKRTLEDRVGIEDEHESGALTIVLTETGQTWVMAHYEQFIERRDAALTWMREQVWDVIILDECHKIKNPQAQRTNTIKHLRSRYKWGLTASPIADKPVDLWGLLNWVAPVAFTSRWKFVDEYTMVEVDRYGHRKTGEPRNLNRLRKEVAPYLLSRTRQAVGMELPPLTVEDVWLESGTQQGALYEKMEKQFLVEIAEDTIIAIPSALARFTRLHQVASDPSCFGVSSNTKLEWFTDYLESGGPPAVIMTRYINTAATIESQLRKARRTDFLVGTYGSLAEGHNLQTWSHLIMWDMCYSRQTYEQAVGRVYRQGQTQPVVVHRLMVEETVDQDVEDTVARKLEEAQMIMNYIRRKER